MLEHIVFNLAGRYTREHLHGRLHYVVPTAILAEGVIEGSQGPLLYLEAAIRRSVPSWNAKPLVINHPVDENDDPVMACSQAVLNRQQNGIILDTSYDHKLRTYSWVDVDRTRTLDARILTQIEAASPIEVSTGVFTRNQAKRGTFRGTPYHAIAHDLGPDHLAVLPDRPGAYSVRDGGGMFALNEKQWEAYNNAYTAKERKALAKSGAAMRDGTFPIANAEDLRNAVGALGRAKNRGAARRHILRRARTLGLTKMLPDGWGRRAAPAANELSFGDTSVLLAEALAEKYGEPGKLWAGYVCEVFKTRVVFRTGYDSDRYWQIEYTQDGDTVSLSGDAVPVEREFVPVAGGETYSGNEAPVHSTEDSDMAFDKKAHIDTLIAANGSVWKETDRAALTGLPDSALEKLTPGGVVARPAANGGQQQPATPPTNPITPTVDAWIKQAPPELQASLQDMVVTTNAERERLIAKITACPTNVFPADDLRKAPVANLRGLAALIPDPAQSHPAGFPGAVVDNSGIVPIVGPGAMAVNYGPAAGVAPANFAANGGFNPNAPLAGQADLGLPQMTFDNPLAGYTPKR